MSTKQAIGTKMKNKIWDLYFATDNSLCMCCKQNKISKKSYHAGHIIAEKKAVLL
jgi:hypothetical protein